MFAVLVHSGISTDCGHYYSYVKSAGGGWYCMDDSSVSSASLSSRVLNEKPYILFYKALPQNYQSNTSIPTQLSNKVLETKKNPNKSLKDLKELESILNSKKKAQNPSKKIKIDHQTNNQEISMTNTTQNLLVERVQNVSPAPKHSDSPSNDSESDSCEVENLKPSDTSRKWFKKSDPSDNTEKTDSTENRNFFSSHPNLHKKLENWDNLKSSSASTKLQIERKLDRQSRSHSRGKVLDEWDKKIDQGKLKRVRLPKPTQPANQGNLFQKVSNMKKRKRADLFVQGKKHKRKVSDVKKFQRSVGRWKKKNL